MSQQKQQSKNKNGNKDDWQTPEWFTRGGEDHTGEYHTGLNDHHTIGLDPVAGPDTDHAIVNASLSDNWNALEDDWRDRCPGHYPTVFINPPFSGQIKKKIWTDRIVEMWETGDFKTFYYLHPSTPTVQSWFHGTIGDKRAIREALSYAWFPSGRFSYFDPVANEIKTSPSFGSMLSIFGEPTDRALDWLKTEGLVMEVRE